MIDRTDWDKPFFNKGYWIMENLDRFSLDVYEAMVLLVINYLNETGQPVSYEALMDKCHMDADRVEQCFDSLCAKGYLEIDTSNRDLGFRLDGLLNSPVKQDTSQESQELILEFQKEFGRTFSPAEMERIMQMAARFDERAVRVALGEAAVYDKRNLNYIESILISWHNKGLTPEELENGIR